MHLRAPKPGNRTRLFRILLTRICQIAAKIQIKSNLEWKMKLAPEDLWIFRGPEQLFEFCFLQKWEWRWKRGKSLADTPVSNLQGWPFKRVCYSSTSRLLLHGDAHLVAGDEDGGWRRAWSVGDGGALWGGLGRQKWDRGSSHSARVQQRQSAGCSEQPWRRSDLTVHSTDIVSRLCFAFDEISHSLNNWRRAERCCWNTAPSVCLHYSCSLRRDGKVLHPSTRRQTNSSDPNHEKKRKKRNK